MIYTTTLLPILLSLSLTLTATAHPSATHQKRSVTCLKVGATATATWTNSDDQTCTYVGVVGSNYGENSSGDGEYVHSFPSLPLISLQLILHVSITTTTTVKKEINK